MGTLRRLYLAPAQAPQSTLRGDLPYLFGRIQPAQIARHREPVVALHGAVFRLRDGHGRDGTIRPAVLAYESVRIGQDFVAGGGVERSAFGILDARIVVERGFLGAAGVVDALFAGQRVDVGGVEIEIAGQRAELRGLGNAAEGIFRGNLGQLQRGLQHAVERVAGEVAGIGAGRTLAVKYAHADGTRAGFFQRLNLAQAHQRGEFIAFADHAFRGGRASGHGAADDVLREFSKISFQFLVSSFQLSLRHN